MNIKQASEQSGVSAPNIRFYEREGLLTPARQRGNSYRTYTEENIRTLKLIRMLRMLDVPLPTIKAVLRRRCKPSRPCWSSRPRIWRQPCSFVPTLPGSGRRQKRLMWMPA